ncbi:MAG TPA: hypothetical protein VHY84_27385 [Bryobacteraceae bacterium]|jgi:hypothetical protein|nr:hypothetical protein [Bryobacteraceae bacterium]
MPVFSSSRDRTLYAQALTAPRAVLNSAGVWTSTGVQKVRFNTFTLNPANTVNSPTYKTGLRSRLAGLRGRQAGSWTLQKPFFPSGSAGTAPDDDPILKSIFGATATIVASVSATYNLVDTLSYLFLPTYNKTPGASSPTNSYVLGGIPTACKFTGGGNFLDMEITGTSVGVGDSVNFASYTGSDAILQGGLSTYPAEPSPTVNGNVIPGFGLGAGFSLGGSALAEVRGTAEVSMDLGIEAISDALNDSYVIGFIGGERSIGLSNITCIDSDGSVLNALKAASFTKTPQTIVLQFGNVAGSIVTITLNDVQVGNMTWQESGAALNIQFGQSGANATTSLLTNEMVLACT